MSAARRGGNQSAAHGDLLRFVTDFFRVQGGWSYKVWGGPFGRPGVPDVLGVLAGRLIAVEVKTGAATLSKGQEMERDKLLAAGALYVLCRCPEDLVGAVEAAGLPMRARTLW